MLIEFHFTYLDIFSEKDYLICNWKKSPTPEELKDGLNKALNLAIENNYKKFLANTKLIGELPPLMNDWVNHEWFPRCLDQIQKMAIVIPTSTLAMMSVNQIMTRVSGLDSKYFDTVEKAKSWL